VEEDLAVTGFDGSPMLYPVVGGTADNSFISREYSRVLYCSELAVDRVKAAPIFVMG